MESKIIKLFEKFGFVLERETDTQFVGMCPFTYKSDKFYINKESGLWDSKTAAESGNEYGFLQAVHRRSKSATHSINLRQLSIERSISLSTLIKYEVCCDRGHTDRFILPVKNANGYITDLRTFKLGGKLYTSPSRKAEMLNIHRLNKLNESKTDTKIPIFLCEGEWDCMKLDELLNKAKMPGIVLGVPGAGCFKGTWGEAINLNKNINAVYVLFDNDVPGEKGMIRVQRVLHQFLKTFFIHWKESDDDKTYSEGYDIRDFIKDRELVGIKPKEIYNEIMEKMHGDPRTLSVNSRNSNQNENENGSFRSSDNDNKKMPIENYNPDGLGLRKLKRVFQKWLVLENFDILEVVLTVVITERMASDPLWLFLIGPSGCGKTEILQSLQICENVKILSSLTSKSLISGMNTGTGRSASLLPHLQNKTLIMKDFTSIIGKPDMESRELVCQLRECYDGLISKHFGTGECLEYRPHFSFIAATTPESIDIFTAQHAQMGERFVKFRVPTPSHSVKIKMCMKAQENLGKKGMKDELSKAVYSFLTGLDHTQPFPMSNSNMREMISELAIFTSQLRASITTNLKGVVVALPTKEIGTRMSNQMNKFAKGLAFVRGKERVTLEEYALCKKISLDSVDELHEFILRTIWKWTNYSKSSRNTTPSFPIKMLYKSLHNIPQDAIDRVVNNLHVLKILRKVVNRSKSQYYLTARSIATIERCRIYENLQSVREMKRSRPDISDEEQDFLNALMDKNKITQTKIKRTERLDRLGVNPLMKRKIIEEEIHETFKKTDSVRRKFKIKKRKI